MEAEENLELLAGAKIWSCGDRVFVTDPLDSARIDAVFPLCAENLLLASRLKVREGSRALDLCTGCGILAIHAAEYADEVVGVDINPRAIEFAKVNAALNGVAQKIDFRIGDLFEPVCGETFDLIMANPPFEPIPKDVKYHLHSDGGPSGTEVLERICDNAWGLLRPGGVLQAISYVPEDHRDLLNRLRAAYAKVRIERVLRLDAWGPEACSGKLPPRVASAGSAAPVGDPLECSIITACK